MQPRVKIGSARRSAGYVVDARPADELLKKFPSSFLKNRLRKQRGTHMIRLAATGGSVFWLQEGLPKNPHALYVYTCVYTMVDLNLCMHVHRSSVHVCRCIYNKYSLYSIYIYMCVCHSIKLLNSRTKNPGGHPVKE